MTNVNPAASHIKVGTTAGLPINSSATCDLALPSLPSNFLTIGHVMEGFHENLIGIGPICDAKYSVLFDDDVVTIISPTGTPVLTGWREGSGHKLWCMSLQPYADDVTTHIDKPGVSKVSLAAFSAYDLPSVEALVRYFHAAAGYSVRNNWLKAINSFPSKSVSGRSKN